MKTIVVINNKKNLARLATCRKFKVQFSRFSSSLSRHASCTMFHVPCFMYHVSVIGKTRIRHRGLSPRTSERGHRVRAGCSPPLSFVASSRTRHPTRSAPRNAPRASKTTATVVIIIVANSTPTSRVAITRKSTRTWRLPPRHPRTRASKGWCLCTRSTARFIPPYERRRPPTFNLAGPHRP